MKSKMVTREEVKKRITETIREVISSLFGISNEAAKKGLRAALGDAMQDKDSLFRASLVYQLNKLTESGLKGRGRRGSEQELQVVLAQIKAAAPEMASALRRGLKDLQTQLPRQGGPGREEILSATEKREACEQIGSLHKMGKVKRWPDIFETVAVAFGAKGKKVSARTIKRAWERRETLYCG